MEKGKGVEKNTDVEKNKDVEKNTEIETLNELAIKSELSEMKLIIEQLHNHYKDDQFIRNKLLNFVRQIPNILKTVGENKKISEERKEELTQERDLFISSFFQQKNKQYFYIPNSGLFIKYDSETYQICKEDDILHDILSCLSRNKKLTSWKYRIKNTTFKMIKERTIFKAIPNSHTIQNVVSILYPSLFKTKNHAKYFLTIIGDNILKKQQKNIFFISPQSKSFLKEIMYICDMYFETFKNPVDCFKFKYYDHNYDNCRIMDTCKECNITEIISKFTKQFLFLDFLCVAIHYSARYTNSDNFLENHCDDTLFINKVLYLKNNDENKIVKQFTDEYIMLNKTQDTAMIDWNTILFLWKNFLEVNNFPNIMFQSTLKTILINKFKFDETQEVFTTIQTKRFVNLSYFITFWKKTITKDYTNEYDTDEIALLFKNYSKEKDLRISETEIITILNYFMPNTEIVDNKTIQNISCEIWNKNEDVKLSLDFIREKYKMLDKKYRASFYDIYNEYCCLCEDNEKKYIVKKIYFEKYILDNISGEFIDDDEFLNQNWWTQ